MSTPTSAPQRLRRRSGRTKDPLAPLESVVTLLISVFVGSLLLIGIMAGVDVARGGPSGATVFGFGAGSTCIDTRPGESLSSRIGNLGLARIPEADGEFGTSAGSLRPSAWTVCLDDPTTVQYVVARADTLATATLFLVSMGLLVRVLRRARRDGYFHTRTCNALIDLGRFLGAYGFLAGFALEWARAAVVDAVFPQRDIGSSWDVANVDWTLVVAGLGLITVARVLAEARPRVTSQHGAGD
ncbi:hypothetical protein [Nocardioides perillae]|uniref:DUF2975 domain-containing protein n=1 Tax=Nocardioides perillae TaxID=1119534 RepID=A0A7Y9RSB4_9ACTN|nr:hypothetical protein [Nocardioides perillae]NYG55717.1 hypothetical protein [Nocardioides perillae]